MLPQAQRFQHSGKVTRMKGGNDRVEFILPGCPRKNVRSFLEPLWTFTLIAVKDFSMISELFLPQNWDMLEALIFRISQRLEVQFQFFLNHGKLDHVPTGVDCRVVTMAKSAMTSGYN